MSVVTSLVVGRDVDHNVQPQNILLNERGFSTNTAHQVKIVICIILRLMLALPAFGLHEGLTNPSLRTCSLNYLLLFVLAWFRLPNKRRATSWTEIYAQAHRFVGRTWTLGYDRAVGFRRDMKRMLSSGCDKYDPRSTDRKLSLQLPTSREGDEHLNTS